MTLAVLTSSKEDLKYFIYNMKMSYYYSRDGFDVCVLRHNSSQYIFIACGEGKVNFTRAAQYAIDKYSVNSIISMGMCGTLIPGKENIGKIFVPEETLQLDVDYEVLCKCIGEIPGGEDYRYIKSNEKINKGLMYAGEKLGYEMVSGGMLTADRFIDEPQYYNYLWRCFDEKHVDTSAGVIAQTAYLSDISFSAIRGVVFSAPCCIKEEYFNNKECVIKKMQRVLLQYIYLCK